MYRFRGKINLFIYMVFLIRYLITCYILYHISQFACFRYSGAYLTNQICTNEHQYTRPLLLAVVLGSVVAMCVCFVLVRVVSVLQYHPHPIKHCATLLVGIRSHRIRFITIKHILPCPIL